MIYARQSTAIIVTVGPVLDADGVAVTDAVVGDFKISKNGGAPAALNGSATLTHRHTGHYSLSLTTSDVGTVGTAEIVIDDTTNACPPKEIQVVEEAVYDALFAASANGFAGAAGSSTVTFSNTSIGTVTTLTNLPSIPNNWLTAAGINADAFTAAKFADDCFVADNFGDDCFVAGNFHSGVGAEFADAFWDEVLSGHAGAGSAGLIVSGIGTPFDFGNGASLAGNFIDFASLLPISLILVPRQGTADSGTTTTLTDSALNDNNAGAFVGNWLTFVSGSNAYETRLITGFNPATDTLTFAPATTNAVANGMGYAIISAADGWASASRTLTALDEDSTTIDLDATIQAALSTATSNITSILADTNELQTDWANGGRLDLILDARASQSSVDDVPTNAEFEARTLVAAAYFDPAADTVANVTTVGSVTTKTGYSLASAYDLYSVDINLTVDEANTQDEWTICWKKNGIDVTSGITVPTLQVVKRSDGTDLVASHTPTQVGSTGVYKSDQDTNRVTAGEAVVAVVTATIDGSSRTWRKLLGRDSSA
jgi:hypothetical protein